MATTIEKQTWLVDTIQRHGRITLKELSRIWEDNDTLNPDALELSERTFHRHREEIERIFGVSIKCDKRDGSRYYIDEDEGDVKGREIRSWMLSTIAVDNLLNQSRDVRNRIQFEQIPSGQQYLSTLISCMRDNLKVRLTYRSFREDEPQTIVFEPYFVKVFQQRWYVVGPSDKHPGNPHTYALDRVVGVAPTSDTFSLPADFDPDTYFRYSFGVFHSDETPLRIVIRVSRWQSKYIESLPLHWSQEKLGDDPVKPGWCLYGYHLCPNFDFIQEIASKGDNYEVLEPAEFRQQMADYLKSAASLYRKRR